MASLKTQTKYEYGIFKNTNQIWIWHFLKHKQNMDMASLKTQTKYGYGIFKNTNKIWIWHL